MAKTYGKHTSTWQMFEAVFLEANGKTMQGDWINIPCNSKGQAINLAIGMNTCNMQWHLEHGVDKKLNKISARPVELPDGTWLVEITESKIHNRAQAKMANVLEQVLLMQNSGLIIKPRAETLDPNEPGISPGEKIRRLAQQDNAEQASDLGPASSQSQILPERGPVSDDLFTKMFDLGKEQTDDKAPS